MTEKFFNFKDLITSWGANQRDIMILKSGVWAGFDAMELAPSNVGELSVRLNHSITGVSVVDNNLTASPKYGCLKTPQGVVIKETSKPYLPITPNTAQYSRIDTVICTHEHVSILGGAAHTYSIIVGTAAIQPLKPEIPEPNKTVVIGHIIVAPLAFEMNDLTFVREKSPNTGNTVIDTPNVLRAMVSQGYPSGTARPINGFLNLPKSGNVFTVGAADNNDALVGYSVATLPNLADGVNSSYTRGTVVYLVLSEDVTILDEADLYDLNFPLDIATQKPIIIGTGAAITMRSGGVIALIEKHSNWSVISAWDFDTNPFKETWGNQLAFQKAVQTAAAAVLLRQSTTSVTVSLDGSIENGTAELQKNINTVVMQSSISLKTVDNAYPNGTFIVLDFTVVGGANAELNTSSVDNDLNFRANGGGIYAINNGSTAVFMQKANGLWLIGGNLKKRHDWIYPSTGDWSVMAGGGAFGYQINTNTGRIYFTGVIEIGANKTVQLLSLPSTMFDPSKQPSYPTGVFVMGTQGAGGLAEYPFMYYRTDNGNIIFEVQATSQNTTFNFINTSIAYK